MIVARPLSPVEGEASSEEASRWAPMTHVEGGNVGQAPCRIQLSSSIYVVWYWDGGWGKKGCLNAEENVDRKNRMQERSDERRKDRNALVYVDFLRLPNLLSYLPAILSEILRGRR